MKTKLTIIKILFQIFFCLVIGFWFYMGILGLNFSSKEYKDLTYVSGIISGYRTVIHIEPPNRFGVREKVKVLAFRIDKFQTEFGITEREKMYEKVKGIFLNKDLINAQLYYDEKGQTLEEYNINLHIYELKLDNSTILSLKDKKDTEKKGSLIWFSIGLFFLGLNIYAIKGFKNIPIKDKHNKSKINRTRKE